MDFSLKNAFSNLLREAKKEPIRIETENRIEYRLPNGELHRDGDFPAVERANGTKFYYKNGELHREDGLPAVEYSDGSKEWRIHGKLHRKDGPAREIEGNKEWYLDGKLHRKDGPAIEWRWGQKEWYINGRPIISIKDWISATGISDKHKLYSLNSFSYESFQIVNDLLKEHGFEKEAEDMTKGGILFPGSKEYILIPNELNDLVSRIVLKQ
jgi:hypothetical protein